MCANIYGINFEITFQTYDTEFVPTAMPYLNYQHQPYTAAAAAGYLPGYYNQAPYYGAWAGNWAGNWAAYRAAPWGYNYNYHYPSFAIASPKEE